MATLETLDVIEAGLACIVWQVEGNTPIETDNEEAEVVADAKTCAEGLLTEEVAQLKVAVNVEFINVLIIKTLARG